MPEPLSSREGLISRSTSISAGIPHISPLSHGKLDGLRDAFAEDYIAAKYGFSSVAIERYPGIETERLALCIGSTGSRGEIGSMHYINLPNSELTQSSEPAKRLVADLPEKIGLRALRSIERMGSVKAVGGVNIHASPHPALAPEDQELAPCLIPNTTPGISAGAVAGLIKGASPQLVHRPFYVSGATAFDDGSTFASANEVMLHWVFRNGKLGELSYLAKGQDGNRELIVQPKSEIELSNTVLIQAGVYRKRLPAEPLSRYAFEVSGEISPQSLGDLASRVGYGRSALAYQVFLKGEHSARAIHSFPSERYANKEATISDNFSENSWSGTAVATGIRFDTPYSIGGHLHVVDLLGKNGGHWLGTKGEAIVTIHELPVLTTAQFDPSSSGESRN